MTDIHCTEGPRWTKMDAFGPRAVPPLGPLLQGFQALGELAPEPQRSAGQHQSIEAEDITSDHRNILKFTKPHCLIYLFNLLYMF